MGQYAIVTKLRLPTRAHDGSPIGVAPFSQGTRILSAVRGARRAYPYDYSTTLEVAHRAAAEQLAQALGWAGRIVSGELPNGDWAHCIIQED